MNLPRDKRSYTLTKGGSWRSLDLLQGESLEGKDGLASYGPSELSKTLSAICRPSQAAGKPAYGAICSSVSMTSSRVAPLFRAILMFSSSPWTRPRAARAEIVQRLLIFSGSPLLDQISPDRNSST